MKRLFTYLLLIACWTPSLPIFAQQSFSLNQAVEYGIKNAAATKKDLLKIADAEQQIKAVRASGFPQFNGSVEYQYFAEVPEMVIPKEFDPTGQGGTVSFQKSNNLNLGINTGFVLFDGAYLVGLKAAKFYRELVHAQAEITPINIRKNITDSYYTVLIAMKNKEQLEKNITVLQKMRGEAEQIYKNGFAEKMDIDRLDLSISNLQSTMNNLIRNIEILKNILKFQMNYPLEQEITLTDEFDVLFLQASKDDGKSVEQFNINKRPEYRAMGKGIELAALDVKRQQQGYLPSLSFYASFTRGLQSDNIFKPGGFWIPTTVIGLKLNVPIYDSGMKKAVIQRARIVVEQNTLDRSEFERAGNLEVTNTQKAYLNSIETVKEKQKSLDLAEEIFKVAQTKYKEGVGTSLEISQAETDLYGAQAALIQAQGDVINARFAVEKALGNFN